VSGVACVVVTRDRRELLRECLAAVAAQTRPVDRLVVVDNASSDGTGDMLRAEHPQAEVVTLRENTGGAGGFHAGVEAAYRGGPRWIWLIDDDTVPAPDALERLLDAPWARAGVPAPSILASRVNWTDGRPHPMNRPTLRRRDLGALVTAARAGLVPLRASTFVSCLIAGDAVTRHGLPRREFFLQADDIEFTARVLRHEQGLFVPSSVVEHRTAAAHDFTSDAFRFFFHLRNTLWMIRGSAWSPAEKVVLGWVVVHTSRRFLQAQGITRESAGTIARGLREGLSPL
jgi:GT2 family glycosyltransferase